VIDRQGARPAEDDHRGHRPGLGPAGHAETGAVVTDHRADPGQVQDPLLEPGAGAAEAPRRDDEEDGGWQAGYDDADAAEGHSHPAGEEPDPAHRQPTRSAMSMTAWIVRRTRMLPPMAV
jgi:hypothetical protein